LPSIKQDVQRDREIELQHRGTMYMRAIQHFYKRMGSYPTSLEQLENSNHVRFLRKRYKDPMTWDKETHKEKDFKLLHMQDIMLGNGPTLGGQPGVGGMPGQAGLGGQLGGQLGQLGQGANALGGIQNALGLANQLGGAQGIQSALNQNANPTAGASSDSSDQSGQGAGTTGTSGSPPGTTPGGTNPAGPGASGNPALGGGPNGQTFGGGAIVGVASTDKKHKSILEFNKKNHYNDWYFIYDPASDTGKLLVGPWQPLTIGSGGIGQPIGTGPAGTQPGNGQSGFGQSGFGQSGFGQSGPGGQQPGFGQTPPNSNQQNQQQ
jgi:hypothetical protein